MSRFHYGADSHRFLRYHVSKLWYLLPWLGPPRGTGVTDRLPCPQLGQPWYHVYRPESSALSRETVTHDTTCVWQWRCTDRRSRGGCSRNRTLPPVILMFVCFQNCGLPSPGVPVRCFEGGSGLYSDGALLQWVCCTHATSVQLAPQRARPPDGAGVRGADRHPTYRRWRRQCIRQPGAPGLG
jgi:hypothetical protein